METTDIEEIPSEDFKVILIYLSNTEKKRKCYIVKVEARVNKYSQGFHQTWNTNGRANKKTMSNMGSCKRHNIECGKKINKSINK